MDKVGINTATIRYCEVCGDGYGPRDKGVYKCENCNSGAGRTSRIEARFERLLAAVLHGAASLNVPTIKFDLAELWVMAEQAETFLEGKRK
jgi:hypothetical protein